MASRELIKDADAIMRDLRYAHGTSNNQQYLARIALEDSAGSLDAAVKQLELLEAEVGVIEPVDDWTPGQRHTEFWTGVGLMCVKAEIKWRQQKMSLAADLTNSVASLLRRKKINVMEVFCNATAIAAFSNRYGNDGRPLAVFTKAPMMFAELRSVAEGTRRYLQHLADIRWPSLGRGAT